MIKLPSLRVIGIAAVVILILYAWGATQYAISQKNKKDIAETERDQAVSIATSSKSELTRYVNSLNNEVAKTKSMEISLSNINRLIDTKDMAWLKQFESLRKKYKNLESAMSVSASFQGDSIIKRTVYVPCADTLEVFRYYVHDEFNFIDAIVLDTPVFEVRVPIHVANLWGRKKFIGLRIGKKEWFTEVPTPNKLIRIDSLVSYTTGKKK